MMLKQIASLTTAGIVAMNGILKAQAENVQNNADIITMRVEDHYHTRLLEQSQHTHHLTQNIASMQLWGTSVRMVPRNSFRIKNMEEEEINPTPPRPATNNEHEALPPRAGILRRGRLTLQELEEEEGPLPPNLRTALREIEEAPGVTSPLRMVVVDREGVAHEIFDLETYFKQHMFNLTSLHFRQSMTGHQHNPTNTLEFGVGQEHGIKLNLNQFHASFNAHTLEQNTTNFGKFGFSFEGLKLGDINLSMPELSLGFMTDAKHYGLEKHTYVTVDASLTAEYPVPLQIPGHRFRLAANVAPLSFAYLGSHFEDTKEEEESLRVSQTATENSTAGAFDLPIQGGLFHDFASGPLQINNWVLGKTAPYMGPQPRFLHQVEVGSQLSMYVGNNVIGSIAQSMGVSDLEASFNTTLSVYDVPGDFSVSGNLMYIKPHNTVSQSLGTVQLGDYWMLDAFFSKRIGDIVYGAHVLCNDEFGGLSLVINMPFTENKELVEHTQPSPSSAPHNSTKLEEQSKQEAPENHVILPFGHRKLRNTLGNKIMSLASLSLKKVS